MFIYFTFMSFLTAAIFYPRNISYRLQAVILFTVFSIFIGLREKVGGDWHQYLAHYNFIAQSDFIDGLLDTDIGYVLLNDISAFLNGGIYLVNLLASFIFLYGLYYFIKTFKLNFSLSILIAFPYLITVISMGYTRQSIALGIIMIMISLLSLGKKRFSLFMLFLAIFFHKTAIFGVIFFIETISVSWILVLSSIIGIFYILFQDILEVMYRVYFLQSMQSSGGFIRLLLLVLISVLFFYFRKRWRFLYGNDYKLFSKMGKFSILFFVLLVLSGASTLFDRISLYLYPLQIVVLSRVFYFLQNKNIKTLYLLSIIVLYNLMLFIFLVYSNHRYAWVPYNNLLFGVLN